MRGLAGRSHNNSRGRKTERGGIEHGPRLDPVETTQTVHDLAVLLDRVVDVGRFALVSPSKRGYSRDCRQFPTRTGRPPRMRRIVRLFSRGAVASGIVGW